MDGKHQLVLRGVTKDFVGLRALDDVSLQLEQGEILGLIGPNGSGKTTLINVVTGLLPASGGKVIASGSGYYEHAFSPLCARRSRTYVPDHPPFP